MEQRYIYKYPHGNYTSEVTIMPPEDAQKQLTDFFPELARASMEKKTLENGTIEVTFRKKAGTKG